MFKPNKKILLAVLLSFAAASIVFIVYKIKANKQVTAPVEKFQQNLNIPNYFQGSKLKVANNIKGSAFKFPQKLPYLQQAGVPPMSMEEAKKIASNLGLSGDPLIVSGVEKVSSLIWNGDKVSLIITQSTNNIQVVSSVSVRSLVANGLGSGLAGEKYLSLAQDFMANRMDMDPPSLHFSGYSYFKVQDGVETFVKGTKNDYDVVQLNYYSGSASLPIVTTNPDEPQIYIQFLKDGTLVSFTANLGSSLQSSPNEYPLKNYDQFSQELDNGIIVSLNDNNINLPDLKSSSISNVKVDNVSLVYLLTSPTDTVIQPVFLIQGTADVLGSGNVALSMYLPAFESFSPP